jgi:Na+-driven multidrug efflux pump
MPNMVIGIFSATCMPFYAWFFISYLRLGYLGAAYAVDTGYLSSMLCFAAISTYINWKNYGTTEYAWPGWSWEMVKV